MLNCRYVGRICSHSWLTSVNCQDASCTPSVYDCLQGVPNGSTYGHDRLLVMCTGPFSESSPRSLLLARILSWPNIWGRDHQQLSARGSSACVLAVVQKLVVLLQHLASPKVPILLLDSQHQSPSTSSMASIEQLPVELLDQISERLQAKALSALSMTCAKLRHSIEPSLYRHISLTWSFDKPHPPVTSLLFTFLDRPDLADRVKSIDFSGLKNRSSKFRRPGTNSRNRDPPVSVWRDSKHGPSNHQGQVKALLDQAGLGQRDRWLQLYQSGEVDVIVALILAQTTNLETLKLSTEFMVDTTIVGDLLQTQSASANCCFANLKHVEYGNEIDSVIDVYKFSIDAGAVVNLLRLPRVETLRAVVPFQQLSWSDEHTRCVSLRSLHLPFCGLGGFELQQLLGATPNLAQLSIHHLVEEGNLCHTQMLQSPDFRAALEKVSTTLQCLSLRVEIWSMYTDIGIYPDDADKSFGKGLPQHLHSMTKLRYLQLPFIGLFGWNGAASVDLQELLPPNLETLHLTDDLADLIDYPLTDDESLLRSFQSFLSCLPQTQRPFANLLMYLDVTDEQWHQDKMTALQQACQNVGVTCQVRKVLDDI
jgi:hypothetical protein